MEDDPTLGFKPEEAAQFIEALDQLGADFDTDATSGAEDQQFVIEEDDWHWLTKQVGTRNLEDTVRFGERQAEQIAADPELVRAAPLTPALIEMMRASSVRPANAPATSTRAGGACSSRRPRRVASQRDCGWCERRADCRMRGAHRCVRGVDAIRGAA